MPTMAEQAGLRPLTMAEQAGLSPVQAPNWEAQIVPGSGPKAAPAPEVEHPGIMARIGRGAADIYQGLSQRVLQGLDTLPREQPSIQELRANASPDEQKLSDEDLRKKFEQQSLSKNYTEKVNDEVALYDKGREGQGRDYARFLGAAAAAAPASVVIPGGAATSTLGKILTRAKMGAIGGGAAGAAEFTPSNDIKDTAVNAAVGAGTGAAAGPILGAVGDKVVDAAQWLRGRIAGLRAPELTEPDVIKAVPEAANLPPAQRADLIAEAQNQMRTTGALDADALSRKANLIAQGVTPTKSMVTRNPRDWTQERNLQKLSQSPDPELSNVGQELTSVYEANDKALGAKLAERGQGLPQGTQEAHGMTAMKSLDDLAKLSQKEVTNTYETIRAAHGDQLASDARNVVNTLTDPNVADNAYAEPIINSVTKRLKRYGMIGEDGKPTSNTMTVTQADEFRKFLQTLKTGDGKTDRIVGQFIKATDQDVLSGAGTDVMASARQHATQRFDTLNNAATQRALNAYGELNQGKTAQNFIQTNIISGADQDVASLLDTLGKLPPDKAATATNAIKAGVLQHLQDRAIDPRSGKFSGMAFDKAIRQIGDTKGARIFGDEWQKLKDLARAGVDATYEPAYSAVNHSNTAPMLLSLIRAGRGTIGLPLPILNETVEKTVERAGARSQLASVLKAQAPGPAPAAPQTVQEIARLLSQGSAPIAAGVNPALNNRRQPSN